MRIVLCGVSCAALLLAGCSNKNLEQGSAQHVSNINQVDDKNDLALHDAIRAKDAKSAKLLIQANTNLNTKDEFGNTPLHLTAVYNQEEIANALIQKSATVNTQDNYGDTPLIDATRNNYFKIARLLVCNDAQRDAQDNNGLTPLHYASQAKNADMVELLLSSNLDIFCQERLTIEMNALEDSTQKSVSVCGTLKEGVASKVTVDITTAMNEPVQTLDAKINAEKKTWCSPLSNELALGSYNIKALGVDKSDNSSEVTGTLNIVENITLPELDAPELDMSSEAPTTSLSDDIYESLNKALAEDLMKWDATLDKESLTIAFNAENTFFARGYSQVPAEFQTILAEFFPKLVTQLKPYEGRVKVLVQGHTSSTFDSSSDENIKFMKNEILSQKRAQNVYDYVKALESDAVVNNQTFIEKDVTPIAKSSLQTIKNDDLSENFERSRRVDFKVEVLNEETKLPEGFEPVAPVKADEATGIEEIDLLQ